MENRFLCRAKLIDTGEWVQGNLMRSNDAEDGYEAIIIPTNNSNMFTKGGIRGDLGFENWHRVDQSTICQCTGLKDDYNNPIFENDILFLKDEINGIEWKTIVRFGNPNEEYYYGWQLVPIAKFDGNKDILLWVESELEYMRCEVIGNAIDNPKLLEVQE